MQFDLFDSYNSSIRAWRCSFSIWIVMSPEERLSALNDDDYDHWFINNMIKNLNSVGGMLGVW